MTICGTCFDEYRTMCIQCEFYNECFRFYCEDESDIEEEIED